MAKTRDWSLHDYWNRLLPNKGRFALDFAQAAKVSDPDVEVTDDLLAECYVTAARLVEAHGEVYLPLFERLHAEIGLRRRQHDLLVKARSVARNVETNLL